MLSTSWQAGADVVVISKLLGHTSLARRQSTRSGTRAPPVEEPTWLLTGIEDVRHAKELSGGPLPLFSLSDPVRAVGGAGVTGATGADAVHSGPGAGPGTARSAISRLAAPKPSPVRVRAELT
jgi:hypothetical protein